MTVKLVEKKNKCCGCGACVSICPKNAIAMEVDEFGVSYPQIDNKKCIECGLCKGTCNYNTAILNTPINVYAAANKNTVDILNATSGGIFTAMAKYCLSKDGYVYGVALDFENQKINCHHIEINNVADLPKIQKSKYVQSDMEFTFKQIKQRLLAGKKVLFSGTPCQVSALKGYLKKDYDNLFTIDLICHGVPSLRLFADYVKFLEQKHKVDIRDYNFRDKKKGWGSNTSIVFNKNGKYRTKYVPSKTLSYTFLFYDCASFRENCYSCPYAKKERVGDITIGDFWGIEKEYPDLVTTGFFDIEKGVSCVLVNTEKGQKFFNHVVDQLNVADVELEKIMKYNRQLVHPATKAHYRELFLEIYKNEQYQGVEKWFNKQFRSKRLFYYISDKIPYQLRKLIKKVLRR